MTTRNNSKKQDKKNSITSAGQRWSYYSPAVPGVVSSLHRQNKTFMGQDFPKTHKHRQSVKARALLKASTPDVVPQEAYASSVATRQACEAGFIGGFLSRGRTLRYDAHSYLCPLPQPAGFVRFGSLSNTLTVDISRSTMCTWATIGKFSWAPLIFIRGPVKCNWVWTALHPPCAPANHHMLLRVPLGKNEFLSPGSRFSSL